MRMHVERRKVILSKDNATKRCDEKVIVLVDICVPICGEISGIVWVFKEGHAKSMLASLINCQVEVFCGYGRRSP